MFQRSRLDYQESNNSPPFSDDDYDKTYTITNVLEEYYNDSTPEIPNSGLYGRKHFMQKDNPITPRPRDEGELVSVYEISRKYQHIFSSYPCFNSVQSKVLDDVLYSDIPMVVSAPTGSGKTVIFELAIIRLLMKLDEVKYEGEFIIVYMAPVKALCSERYFDWKAKFSALGINCQEVTGDTDDYTLANLPRSNLILTTPEKWDSLTRKWKDNTKMVQLVKLFLIDEVHLLSEEKRGPTLEAVVSRMKTITDVLQKQKLQHKGALDSVQLPVGIRFIAVSATICNIEDVASWLGTSSGSPAKYFKISEEQRPVKLQKIVIGYSCPSNYSQFRFEISLSFKLRPLLFKYAEGKPTLIFCSTRKGVDQTCSTLSQQITFSFNEEHRRQLLETAQTLSENKLKSCIVAGVGYHHAGMDRDDRHTVENLFRAGLLPVLVATSTLATGVNLPAHLVIIKATQQYAGGAYHDYTETQILQMIGRAGRPQYDTSAVAIIMTKESQKLRYENLIEGKEPLESNLHRHLAEHLNSEVVLHTITEVGHAIEWIRSTFLYVRALQNPCHYGIPAKISKKGIETKLQEMCQRELNALASANLITVDNLTDIRPTANGVIMARFYLGLGTMKIFKKVTGQENLEDLLHLIAACDEFSGLKLRVNEKKNLNLLNKSKDHETIRFPLRGKIANTEMKVNCLIQALFGCLPVYEQSLKQDMLRISWTGERVTMALCQYLLQYKHYKALLYATILAKCFRCKLWENSPYVSRQLRGIGPALSSLLVASQKTSFQVIAESNPRDIELILNRAPPMGDALKAEVNHLPKFGLRVEPASLKPNLTKLNIYIEMTNRHLVEEYNAAGENHWLVLIVGTSNNVCLLIERFRDTHLLDDTFSRSVTVKHTVTTEIYINLISEQWSGLDVSLTTKFDEPCQAKHTLNQYLLKIGVDSRGKSALQISSEAASIMKKRKRNSLSQEINAINQNSFYDGNRLTLDKFKFTPMRNKKLAASHESILDNIIYENGPREANENSDKYNAVPLENMNDGDDPNVLTMGRMHSSYADDQLDATFQQTTLDKNHVTDSTLHNFRQTQHSLRKRSNDKDTIQNSCCDTTFKDNHFKTMDITEDAENTDSKLCSQISENSETMNADTKVLYTEPCEALENESTEANENSDKYNDVLLENTNDRDEPNLLTMGSLHSSYADEQPDATFQQTLSEENDIDSMLHNFRHMQHCLRKKTNDKDTIQNPSCDISFKDNHFKTMEITEDAENSDSNLSSKISENSETMNADTEVLFTEPCEALDTPYITHKQENKSSKNSTSNSAAYDNALCNRNSNITGWNKLIKRAQIKIPQHIYEIIQDSGIPKNSSACKSSFHILANQTSNNVTSCSAYKSVGQSCQRKEVIESSNIPEASQSKSFLKHFTINHSFQNINSEKISNFNESPENANILSLDHKSIVINADENHLHGSDEIKQIMSDENQHFQNKFLESDFHASEERTILNNQKTYSDFTNHTSEKINQPISKIRNRVQNEKKFKRTLAKHFYPFFMKPDVINGSQDKYDGTERKESYTEGEDTHSVTLQMKLSSLSDVLSGHTSRQTAFELQHAFKDIQENVQNDITSEQNREGSSTGNSLPALQSHECEHQQANINSNFEKSNELQFHPIISQVNTPIKSFTHKFHEKTVESNILAHMNPKAVKILPKKPFPDFLQDCNILQPALSFSLVPDFDKFFEKLSSAEPNSKNMHFYRYTTGAGTSGLTQTAKYNKAWVKDYLFSRKTMPPLLDRNSTFPQHHKRNGTLQDQNIMHYNVPAFNKNTEKFPLNYIAAGPYTKEYSSNNGSQINKAKAILKTNYAAKFNEMTELQCNYDVNENLTSTESKNKYVLQFPNKKYFDFDKSKQHSDICYNPNGKYTNVDNENALSYNIEHTFPLSPLPSHYFDSSEEFNLHIQHPKINDDPYTIHTERIKEKHKQMNNIYETTENKNFVYGDNLEESSNIFHNKSNELFQTFTPSKMFEHSLIFPEEWCNSCLTPSAAINVEETDEGYSNDSLEEEIQDHNKSIVSSPLISNVSPQNSNCCNLLTPPLELSSDESDNCSQCSPCKARTSTVEDIKKKHEPRVVSQQSEMKQYPYMFSMNNIPLSLPAQLSVGNMQHVKQKYPETQSISDCEYKRPRSIYLPNDKLQKFYPISAPGRKIKFSPAYKKLKWLPR